MVHVVEQTQEEKMAMYMKLSKKELSSMLIQANRAIELMNPIPVYYPYKDSTAKNPYDPPFIVTCGN